MIRLAGAAPRSLTDLFERRSELRHGVILVAGALRDVRRELRGWQHERLVAAAAGRQVRAELSRVLEELEQRELELQVDLVQLRHAAAVAAEELDAALNLR